MPLLKNKKVLFSNVVNVDDFTQKYSVVVQLTEDEAADAEEAGLKVKNREYDGKTQFQAQFKSKFRPRIVGNIAAQDYDLEGKEIGRGSTINVQYKMREWTNPQKKTGVSQDLQAIQIVSLNDVSASEFDDVEEFGNSDDGDI